MKRAEGIYCALITPLDERENIDPEATERIARHVLDGGTDGLLALGSTGEQIALTRENKIAFVKCLHGCIPESVPLMVGCGSTSTRLAIQNVHDAQDAGADAVILTPPCFYPFDDDALVAYYTDIAREASVPVYLYNISRFVGVRIGADVVRRLQDQPRIQGIKESDRDIEYLAALLDASKDRSDFSVMEGSERLFFDSFQMGSLAGVTVVGNLAPEIAPRLYAAWRAGDLAAMKKTQELLLEYVRVITMFGRYPLELKECMQARGLCSARMTAPFQPLTADQRLAILRELDALENTQQGV